MSGYIHNLIGRTPIEQVRYGRVFFRCLTHLCLYSHGTEYVIKPLSAIVMYNNGVFTHVHNVNFTYGFVSFLFAVVHPGFIT